MEIAQGVHSIGEAKGGHVHAFLFDHGGELTLVDTLFETDAHVVLDYLRRIGRSPTALRHIALTHAHRSHLGGLATLKRLSGATVYSHEWEADIIGGERLAQPVTLRRLRPLRVYPFRLGLALGVPRHTPCPVDEPVDDEDAIGPLQVVHIPGHSPGHLAFYWPERRVLVAGDAVATWPSLDAGWPGFNLNERQHRASLRRLAELKADVVGVGHGEPITTDPGERLEALVERPFRGSRARREGLARES
jgi:glyoxylase-like metal-dependent hydrolase (beta-lactamase superfamily II)